MTKTPVIRHEDYLVTVLFTVPIGRIQHKSVLNGADWYSSNLEDCRLTIRRCCLDEYSDYGFATEPDMTTRESGPLQQRMYGYLLRDAICDPVGFAEMLDSLPSEWNFGGIIMIDLATGIGFNTNCNLRETRQWARIIRRVKTEKGFEITFPLTDTGLRIERGNDELLVQQTAWEVPKQWGPRGAEYYPIHVLANIHKCVKQLEETYESYIQLVSVLQDKAPLSSAIARLG